MPQNYHLAESRLVDFLFFLLKKKNSAWQSSSYTESARKIMLTICLLGSVTLIDTIPKSLNHFVGNVLCGEMCFVGKCSQRGELQTDQGR